MGRVTVAGGNPGMKAPVTEGLASSLAVGSTVKLMEGGTAVEYLVVNQGIPSNSSLYDASCDGTWLLRKDIHSRRPWENNNNIYETSAINTWLNGDFFNSLGSVEQATIKQVKIPYKSHGGNQLGRVETGDNGLSCRIFLLCGYEVGFTTKDNSGFPVDGACLSYFDNATQSKRIAYMNGTATTWWLRSPKIGNNSYVWQANSNGIEDTGLTANPYGVRPALILPKTALFDDTTLVLKGVA